jgi:predicted dehydrogenase
MTAEGFAATLILEGEKGSLEIRNYVGPQMGCRFTTTIGGETTVLPTDGPTTYAAQLRHLAQVLDGKAQPLPGGADAIANMTAIDAIYRAAGKPEFPR